MFVTNNVSEENGFEEGRQSIIDSLDLTLIPKTEVKLTAYSPDKRSCGKWADGKTSTMTDASKPGAAVDPKLIPYGSILVIDGTWYVADDTGGAMRQATKNGTIHIDIRMKTHAEAMQFGVKTDSITIVMR
jgi:3D (Asp-Asp-Asp) domain-containing protein